LGRVVGPVVEPADDDVAAGEGMAVVAEIAAFEFEFDVDALPAIRADLALGFTVWEAGLHGFDGVAEFLGDQAEKKDDTLFVDGLVAKTAEVHRLAIRGPVIQGRVTKLAARGRRGHLEIRYAVFAARGAGRGAGCGVGCGI
jgi:hypothetical protein